MKFTQRLSLRVRLTLIFLILASVTWLFSSFVAWKQTTDNVDELFDTGNWSVKTIPGVLSG